MFLPVVDQEGANSKPFIPQPFMVAKSVHFCLFVQLNQNYQMDFVLEDKEFLNIFH